MHRGQKLGKIRQWVKSVDSCLTQERKKSVRIDIIIEKNLKKQIRIPEGMTLATGLTHYPKIFRCKET